MFRGRGLVGNLEPFFYKYSRARQKVELMTPAGLSFSQAAPRRLTSQTECSLDLPPADDVKCEVHM